MCFDPAWRRDLDFWTAASLVRSAEIRRHAALRDARRATNALGRADALWEAERQRERRDYYERRAGW